MRRGMCTGSLALVLLLAGAGPRADGLSAMDAYLEGKAGEGFSGGALVAIRGEVRLNKGYGLADRAEGRPVTRETGFLIGSIVKPFTKATIYQLEAEGRLDTGDSIAVYLPGVPADKKEITLEQLLSHRSGFPDIIGPDGRPAQYSLDWDYLTVSRDEIVRRGLAAELVFEPGSDQRYSNLGYSLLAAIVEKVSGQSFEQAVRARIFVPAKMERTGYVMPGWQPGELAVGYRDGKVWGTPLDAGRWMADGPGWNLRGNGGMLGTLDDLYAWIAALREGVVLDATARENFLAVSTGTSRTTGGPAASAAGGNGVFNIVYVWYIDIDRVLILASNVAEFQAESYLSDLLPLLLE